MTLLHSERQFLGTKLDLECLTFEILNWRPSLILQLIFTYFLPPLSSVFTHIFIWSLHSCFLLLLHLHSFNISLILFQYISYFLFFCRSRLQWKTWVWWWWPRHSCSTTTSRDVERSRRTWRWRRRPASWGKDLCCWIYHALWSDLWCRCSSRKNRTISGRSSSPFLRWWSIPFERRSCTRTHSPVFQLCLQIQILEENETN